LIDGFRPAAFGRLFWLLLMKRFLILSGLLFLSLFIWSSMASANDFVYPENSSKFRYYGKACVGESCQDELDYARNIGEGHLQTCIDYPLAGCTLLVDYNNDNSVAESTVYYYSDSNDIPPSEPDCDSPNYIDVVSGECVAPRSVCFTSIHTEENECTYVGGEDPDDPETPSGCTRNYNTGDLICVADDVPAGGEADCFTVNGEQICPTPDAVCGNKNGSFQCLEPQQKGCGSFNGENVCVDPTGHVVPVDDPDHPDNGGNLDGDSKNDPTDSRDPIDGGDPDNQPNAPIDTGANEGSSEKTARESNLKLGKIESNTKSAADALKAMALNGISTDLSEEVSDSSTNAILSNAPAESLISGSNDEMFEFIEGIDVASTGGGYGGGMVSGITDAATDIIPQGVCSELGFNFKGHGFSLGCDKTQRIRDLLSWVFYILTVWFLFDVVTSPTTRQK
jgi:hypothetical protein